MTRVRMYGSQRMIARHNLTLSVYGRVFCCVLLMELLCGLFGREGGDMKVSLCARCKKLTAHLVSDDAHIETKIDLDARMEVKLTIDN